MKKGVKILLSVIAVAAVLMIAGTVFLKQAENRLEALKITEIPDADLGRTEDGTYTGKYSTFPISAAVEVTVKDHMITEIRLVA